jgi:hypothetical protein
VTFDRSYNVLDAADQRTFRLLRLVPGQHFTAAVAGALSADPVDVAGRRLDRLARAHVIERPRRRPVRAARPAGRVRQAAGAEGDPGR